MSTYEKFVKANAARCNIRGRRKVVSHLLKLFCAVIVITVVIGVQNAEAISGKPRVVDGDSLKFGSVSVRLHGIDAPETNQTCLRAAVSWPCGFEATAALRGLIENHWVDCTRRDKDRYGRIVAVCTVGGAEGIDLNREMVANGWAVAYRRYSPDYVAEEDKARKAGRGIWSGDFVEPEQWRRGRRGNSKPDQMLRDKDCGDFNTRQEALSFFETAKPGDPHRHDGDRDGIACESLRH